MGYQEIPDYLIDQINNDKCVFFIGAGLSVDAGLPTWGQLLQKMLEQAKSSLTLVEIEQIKTRLEEDNLLEAASLLRDSLAPAEFKNILEASINRNAPPSEKHYLIAQLPLRAILTTNYDKLIENAYTPIPPIVRWDESTRFGNLPNFYVLKCHGDIDDPKTIILTEEDYDGLSHNGLNEAFQFHLKKLFSDYTVFFISYGLNDPDINWIRKKVLATSEGNGPLHYTLTKNSNFDEGDRDKYRKQNINIIGIDDYDDITPFLQELVYKVTREAPADLEGRISSAADLESAADPSMAILLRTIKVLLFVLSIIASIVIGIWGVTAWSNQGAQTPTEEIAVTADNNVVEATTTIEGILVATDTGEVFLLHDFSGERLDEYPRTDNLLVLPNGNVTAMANFRDGTAIAFDDGTMYFSEDLQTQNTINTMCGLYNYGPTNNARVVTISTFREGLLTAFNNGTVYYSPDGNDAGLNEGGNGTVQWRVGSDQIRYITSYRNGVVTALEDGHIYYSSAGSNLTDDTHLNTALVYTPADSNPALVTAMTQYNNTLYIAFNNGRVYASPDGYYVGDIGDENSDTEEIRRQNSVDVTSMTAFNDGLVVAFENGQIYYSEDGHNLDGVGATRRIYPPTGVTNPSIPIAIVPYGARNDNFGDFVCGRQ